MTGRRVAYDGIKQDGAQRGDGRSAKKGVAPAMRVRCPGQWRGGQQGAGATDGDHATHPGAVLIGAGPPTKDEQRTHQHTADANAHQQSADQQTNKALGQAEDQRANNGKKQ